ncbi:MAG: ribose-phosphate pyrophosphokinase [Planctomycetota bacterium]
MKVLSGTANPDLAQAICSHLGIGLSDAMIERFPDGELNVKVQDDVRGADLFIVQPTCYPQNDTLMELLMLIDSVVRASAGRVTAVMPYYGYARKDRKDEGRVPITAKLVANMLVTAGADRVLAMDLHAPQIQGFFDIPVDHLFARPVLLRRLREMDLDNLVCASPDIGSMKMAIGYAQALGTGVASCHKQRVSGAEVKMTAVVGEVSGRNVLIVDDLIASGSSLAMAAEYLRDAGARDIYACATHPVLCGDAYPLLVNAPIKKIIVTDTIPLPDDGVPEKFEVVSVAAFFAEAIKRIHMNMSVSYLFREAES